MLCLLVHITSITSDIVCVSRRHALYRVLIDTFPLIQNDQIYALFYSISYLKLQIYLNEITLNGVIADTNKSLIRLDIFIYRTFNVMLMVMTGIIITTLALL